MQRTKGKEKNELKGIIERHQMQQLQIHDSVHSRSQRFNESGALELSKMSQLNDTSGFALLSRRERIMQNQGRSIMQELTHLSRRFNKGLAIYERSVLAEHVLNLFGRESERSITTNSNQVII